LLSLAVLAVVGATVAVAVLVDLEQPLVTLSQQAFLSRCLLALLALLALAQLLVVMVVHQHSLASPQQVVVVGARLAALLAVDLAALVAVAHMPRALLGQQHQLGKEIMVELVAVMEYFGLALVAVVHPLLVAHPVQGRLLAMAAMVWLPVFLAHLLLMPQVAVADVG